MEAMICFRKNCNHWYDRCWLCGRTSRKWISACLWTGNRLKTICDVRLDAAEKVKDSFGYEQAISDYEEMLSDPEIDVIDIVTPPFLHCTMLFKRSKQGSM